MNMGFILLAAITMVVVLDAVMALYFRSLADRAESGEPGAGIPNPAATRKAANMMLMMAPLIWLVVALISFGVIPIDGIDPIKF